MSEYDSLTEQLRREIRECMDVFITDGRELADKYSGKGFSDKHPEIAATFASAMAHQYAAVMMADALRNHADITVKKVAA
ncbi:hypothetical protein [Rubrimonas cliftonensis]|uniref:Uncharacterized protein n=1 Tax=Rubrimonas cliftonensis TaxID=89524 RepID=A0A1H3WRR4_9RHOB|nr:hypothetical protein [Rubrimonas cliftonensis]SDZ89819.1 hypothetical protein SAMN05444370_10295 [Rubrimonas cliftonensis]